MAIGTGADTGRGNGTPLGMNVLLWIAQLWVGVCFAIFGYMKVFLPIAQLAGMWHWPGEYPTLVRVMGVVDFAGGIGMVLPALTRIRPGLTVLAALGCVLLQLSAMAFHTLRGEFMAVPFNLLFLLPSLLVLWGRSKYPIARRG